MIASKSCDLLYWSELTMYVWKQLKRIMLHFNSLRLWYSNRTIHSRSDLSTGNKEETIWLWISHCFHGLQLKISRYYKRIEKHEVDFVSEDVEIQGKSEIIWTAAQLKNSSTEYWRNMSLLDLQWKTSGNPDGEGQWIKNTKWLLIVAPKKEAIFI